MEQEMIKVLKDIQNSIHTLSGEIDNLDKKVDTNHIELSQKIDKLDDKIDANDAKNAARHIEILDRLTNPIRMKMAIKFILLSFL